MRLMVSGKRSTAMPASSDINAPRMSATDAITSVVLTGAPPTRASTFSSAIPRQQLRQSGRPDEPQQRHHHRDHQGDRTGGHRSEQHDHTPVSYTHLTLP